MAHANQGRDALGWRSGSITAVGAEVSMRTATLKEAGLFFRAVKAGGSLRDQALFATMYWYGLTAGEVTWLRREDVDLVNRRIIVHRGRYAGAQDYPIVEHVLPLLDDYLRTREDSDPFLFSSREHWSLGVSQQLVRELFKRYARDSGLAHLASYALRHSIAVTVFDELGYMADLVGNLVLANWHCAHRRTPRPPISRQLRTEFMARRGLRPACYYCRKRGSKLRGPDGSAWHIDHSEPYSRTRSHTLNNLVLSCQSCNLKKHARAPHEWPEGGRLL